MLEVKRLEDIEIGRRFGSGRHVEGINTVSIYVSTCLPVHVVKL